LNLFVPDRNELAREGVRSVVGWMRTVIVGVAVHDVGGNGRDDDVMSSNVCSVVAMSWAGGGFVS
jgi:hypothetical protein